MPALTRTAVIIAVSALLMLGGCSKKEPAAPDTPAPAATTTGPAPAARAETSPAAPAVAPAAAMEAAPAVSPAPVVEEPAPAPIEAAAPPAAAEPAAAPPAGGTSATPPAAAAETVAAAAPAKPIDGAAIAQGICTACHGSGMNGAPKLQNKIAWAPRIAQGRDTMYQHAIKGLRGMPPRGGNLSLSDDEVKAAVDYMVKLAGGWKD